VVRALHRLAAFIHDSPPIAILLSLISTGYSPFETGPFTPTRHNMLVRLNERSFQASQQRSETMDTLTQINRLLRHLDATAVALTDAQHPSVDVHLDLNCATPGAADVVECAVEEAHNTETGLDLTLMPVRRHCVVCGNIFMVLPHDQRTTCPDCPAPVVPDEPGTPTP
jgi:hypothetical protein